MQFLSSLIAALSATALITASPVEKRVTAPPKCSQVGTGRYGSFSVNPSSNVARNTPIYISYQQECASEDLVYPVQLSFSIHGGDGVSLKVAEVTLPANTLSYQLETNTPDFNVTEFDSTGSYFSTVVGFTQTADGTASGTDPVYLYQLSQPFTVNSTAPPFEGQS